MVVQKLDSGESLQLALTMLKSEFWMIRLREVIPRRSCCIAKRDVVSCSTLRYFKVPAPQVVFSNNQGSGSIEKTLAGCSTVCHSAKTVCELSTEDVLPTAETIIP